MAGLWYYAHDDNRLGPFSGRQLKDLADSGQLLPTDMVWKAGIEQGVAASRVRNLYLAAPDKVPGNTVAIPEVAAPLEAAPAPAAPAVLPPSTEQPEGKAPEPARPEPHQHRAKRGRAVAGKGVLIVGQDGTSVKFKKKCTVCAHEDATRNTLKITSGMTRLNYYCPKCRKRRDVEIQGFLG